VGDKLHLTVAFGAAGSLKAREAVAAILGPAAAMSARIRKVRMDFAARAGARPSPWLPDGEDGVLDLSAVSTRQEETSAAQPQPRRRSEEPVVVPYAE